MPQQVYLFQLQVAKQGGSSGSTPVSAPALPPIPLPGMGLRPAASASRCRAAFFVLHFIQSALYFFQWRQVFSSGS